MKVTSPFAYRMSVKDIDAHFYENAPGSIFCVQCGSVLDKHYVPASLKLYSRKFPDVGCTYDGRDVCSQRFKDYCEAQQYKLKFFEISSKTTIYYFRPTQVLRFDAARRKTEFLGHCERCGGYEEVIGATPILLLNVSTPIHRGIFRTDLEFGSGASKAPQIVVGLETKAEMVRHKFSGCSFSPVTNEIKPKERSRVRLKSRL